MKRIVFFSSIVIAAIAVASPAQSGGGECGSPAKTPDVAAIVNGVKISLKEVDAPLKGQLDAVQQRVEEARRREVDLQINSRLLEAEAAKRSTTATKLLEMEVVSRVKEPTEEEARAFHEQNKERISAGFDETRTQIIEYLRNLRQGEEAKKLADRLRAGADVKVLVEAATPPATPADRARVFATVNGTEITSGAVEDSLRPLFRETEEQKHSLRSGQLDALINSLLLQQEGNKRGVTARALLESEVTRRARPVTDADASAFYQQNKDQIKGELEQVKPEIIAYLRRVEEGRAQMALAQEFRSRASIEVFLVAPETTALVISTDDQPVKGPAEARVTIVEFTDFECPSCAQLEPVLQAVMTEYGDRVRLVVRDFPLTRHANAFRAAVAAEAAREQGKYWEFASLMFRNQSDLSDRGLTALATRVGLEAERFTRALQSPELSAKVERDRQEAIKLGVNSTPTVFVNGRRVTDRSYEGLKSVLEAALKGN